MTDSRIANLTVAIATLNRPDELARCLAALLSADAEMLPAEVLVVDQGSDERTRQVAEQNNTLPVRIVYIHQSGRGLSLSRNTAIKHATGPVLVVTDDDCVPAPGWVAAIDRAFHSQPAPDAVTGRVLPLGPPRPGTFAISSRTGAVRSDFTRKVPPWEVGTGGNSAVSLAWLKRIGGYDERLGAGSPGGAGEDLDLLYRLLHAGARIRYEPDALIYHERQDQAHRKATRLSYGRGVGAASALWLRQGDRYALRILARWLLLRSERGLNALRQRRWRSAYEEILVFQGTIAGLLYGLRLHERR